MKLVITDEEIEELTIDSILNSADKGKVIIEKEDVGKREEGKTDITKELVAIDSIDLGPSLAGRIHGVPTSSASKYSDGKDIDNADVRSRVLATKNNIADLAIAKLMDSLNMFDPALIDKPKDQIAAASMLAGIVDKVTSKNNGNNNEVHLHLYGPKQNKIEKYEVIDV